MENNFLLPQSKFEELTNCLKDIKDLVLEIKQKPKPFEKWIPELEAQKLLGLKETSLWALRKKGKVAFSKVGSRIFYDINSIEELINKNKTNSRC